MQRVPWYGVLAVVALVAPIAGRAQAPQARLPQATVRELATIEGAVSGFVRLPSGRALIYTALSDGASANRPRAEDSTFTYDIATKQRTLLGTNMLPESVSPQGDRLAFIRSSEDRRGTFLWTTPIDPQTGVTTGQSQRVTLRPTDGRALFSPDGKMLVFSAGPGSDGTWDVAVVPATGGPERVVANYAGRVIRQAWSADGQALFVERLADSRRTYIERIPIAGGPSEAVVPRTSSTADAGNIEVLGFSPDARVAFFGFDPDRFFYRTASGVEGEISVALPPLDEGWGYSFTLDSSLRYTQMTRVRRQSVRILDVATGQSRDLLPETAQSRTPAWSPDGRRLALLTGSLSHSEITVVNADGSSPRRYPLSIRVDGGSGFAWETPWSPDGRFLAFRAAQTKDPHRVAYGLEDRGQIGILDVNSGQARVLTTASAPIGFGRFIWRSDGKAIRAMKRADAPSASTPSRYSVVEIPVDGPERQLLDISTELPKAEPPFLFISDRAVVATVTIDRKTERFVIPLNGGASRRLPDPGIESGSQSGGTAVAGNLLLIGQVDARGEARAIKIVSTVDDSTRTLRLPFNGHHGVPHPDGKQIINVGKAGGDSTWKLFLVPLDGSPTRVVGEIPRGTGGLLAPSPDGKLLAYTSDGRYTSTIHEIDFGPAFQTIVNR